MTDDEPSYIKRLRAESEARDMADAAELAMYEAPFQRPYLHGPGSLLSSQCVYFMQFIGEGDTQGLIKIGTTKQLAVRRHQIPKELDLNNRSAPSWFRVLFTLPGDKELEQELHERFADLCEFGEWFAPEEPLLAYIREQQELGRAPHQ